MFDFNKLRGRIVEKYGSIEKFAKAMDVSATTLGRKLSAKSTFTHDEIVKACRLLEIPFKEVHIYFFAETVKKTSLTA
ncbi:MAG: DUF739 family protein [Clostridia bacterium]|nr:DUF739 family protein [Clostridia bacterium]